MDISTLIDIKKNPKIPELRPGDTVKVSAKVVEGEKERIQVFKGVVIKVCRGADGGNFTVRRVAYGIGVERTFPMLSPLVDKVEIVRHGKVRRARLFYLRGLSGRKSRIKERRVEGLLEPAEEQAAEAGLTEAAGTVETPEPAPEAAPETPAPAVQEKTEA